jgi:diketogulonate reductase-like aldo/keto reductase
LDFSSCIIRSASNPSITSLSDWHIQQIRTLVPKWNHFHAFLENFSELFGCLTEEDLDKLMDAIYPETYAFDDQFENCWTGYDSDGDFEWKDMSVLYSD